jgi:hypothetical protein
MGGGKPDQRLAQEYSDYGDFIMDDVQYGREGTRIPIPYRYQSGPQFDPADVPVFQGPHHKEFDPRYGATELRMLAESKSNQSELADAIRRLLLKSGGSYG